RTTSRTRLPWRATTAARPSTVNGSRETPADGPKKSRARSGTALAPLTGGRGGKAPPGARGRPAGEPWCGPAGAEGAASDRQAPPPGQLAARRRAPPDQRGHRV